MYKRPQTPAVSAPDSTLVAVPLAQYAQTAKPGRGWLHYSNLKIEAAIFMLIALTFAAVLGQEAITTKVFDLTAHEGQYYPFHYSDSDDGGKTSLTENGRLDWSCTLAAGAQYSYCGYGLQLDATNSGKGIDLSQYQNITLHLTYHGVGDHLRLLLQAAPPASIAGKVKPGDTVPFVAEFGVVNGENEIYLKRDAFSPEQWWLTSHNVALQDLPVDFKNVVSVAFSSGTQAPFGRFDVKVDGIAFKGASLTTAQWYLLILSVWLVLTGAFLVMRFLGLRRAYEARQRQQAEEARVMAAAHAAAEQASSAKTQFLANMSHELRTPLNAIIGYAQLLKGGDISDRERSAVTTIEHSGEHLLAMITDILDIAKVEAGRLELLAAPFDLHACIDTVGQMIRLRAEEKGLRFSVVLAAGVPHSVVADQKRVRQVLINLLGNAVKFTSAGDIRLEVSMLAAQNDEALLRFDVIDSGVGIAEDQIGRIFRPFEQAGNAIDRSGGTGLGLAITHQIVRMMGGDIRVESTPGEGSRFIVEAPFRLADATGLPDAAPAPAIAAPETPEEAMTAPAAETLARLLELARTGNLRAIRKEIPAITAMGPQYRCFAERLDALCAAYQSPAVLRLIERSAQERTVA